MTLWLLLWQDLASTSIYDTTIAGQLYMAIEVFQTRSHGQISLIWPIIGNCSDMVRDSGPLLYPNTNPSWIRIHNRIFTNLRAELSCWGALRLE
jgi:hypothetical protein